MKTSAVLVIVALFIGCFDKSNDGTFIKLENLPPNGTTKTFKNYDELYLYFNGLSIKEKNEMIKSQANNHPVVDSLKHVLDEMITNTFNDMLPGQYEKKDSVKKDSVKKDSVKKEPIKKEAVKK